MTHVVGHGLVVGDFVPYCYLRVRRYILSGTNDHHVSNERVPSIGVAGVVDVRRHRPDAAGGRLFVVLYIRAVSQGIYVVLARGPWTCEGIQGEYPFNKES